MINIFCTNKMSKWLGSVKPIPQFSLKENFWNANLFKVERKNWLVCVHSPTTYCLFFPEIKKSELFAFEPLFYARFLEQLQYEGIAEELPSSISTSPIHFYKTNNNKRAIGILNMQVSDLKYSLPYWGGLDEIGYKEVNNRANCKPIGPNPYSWPNESMKQWLSSKT